MKIIDKLPLAPVVILLSACIAELVLNLQMSRAIPMCIAGYILYLWIIACPMFYVYTLGCMTDGGHIINWFDYLYTLMIMMIKSYIIGLLPATLFNLPPILLFPNLTRLGNILLTALIGPITGLTGLIALGIYEIIDHKKK